MKNRKNSKIQEANTGNRESQTDGMTNEEDT